MDPRRRLNIRDPPAAAVNIPPSCVEKPPQPNNHNILTPHATKQVCSNTKVALALLTFVGATVLLSLYPCWCLAINFSACGCSDESPHHQRPQDDGAVQTKMQPAQHSLLRIMNERPDIDLGNVELLVETSHNQNQKKEGGGTKLTKITSESNILFPPGCTWECYLERNPDLIEGGVLRTEEGALYHYVNHGAKADWDCFCQRSYCCGLHFFKNAGHALTENIADLYHCGPVVHFGDHDKST